VRLCLFSPDLPYLKELDSVMHPKLDRNIKSAYGGGLSVVTFVF
jgi:hypothetical protein